MTQTNQKTKTTGTEHLKTMIVTLALAATLFFWAVFSTQDQRDLIADQQNSQPAIVLELPQVGDGSGSSGTTQGSTVPTPTLRSVSQPQPNVVVPQSRPVIIGGGGGGGTVTSTRAS